MMLKILASAKLSLVAIGVAFLNVRLSHLVFVLRPLLFVSHQSVDQHWLELVDSATKSGTESRRKANE
jgi:hypothetical protein